MDITYIPMARGFAYLAVVLDWFSRRVLSWRVSITMEAAFCVETLEDALGRLGNGRLQRRRQERHSLARQHHRAFDCALAGRDHDTEEPHAHARGESSSSTAREVVKPLASKN
jgi:transposase InsO family protein